ncbi:MAG TPA: type II secretion system F family protein [Nocardioidaceae bacterium]|nr:type II secretion system F family protein [Nocardioidaceae bacterium]
MTVVGVLGACLLAAAAGVWSSPIGQRRARALRPVDRDSAEGRRSLVESPAPRSAVCVAAGAGLAWVLLGPPGAAVGALLGAGVSWWVGRLESPSAVRARERMARDLPLALELLAACLGAGRPPMEALGVVSRAVGGPLGGQLDTALARLALGADPSREWRRLLGEPALAPLARAMLRSQESGAALSDGLARLAEDRRREQRTMAQLRARTVGVRAAGPLAVCFLPAFVLVGVVPTIAGAFQHLLG